MKEGIKNFIKNITTKQLIIFIVVTFIFDKIWCYWLSNLLLDILPLTTVSEIMLWGDLFWNFGIVLEISYLVAFVWLIIRGFVNLGKKDYKIKN